MGAAAHSPVRRWRAYALGLVVTLIFLLFVLCRYWS